MIIWFNKALRLKTWRTFILLQQPNENQPIRAQTKPTKRTQIRFVLSMCLHAGGGHAIIPNVTQRDPNVTNDTAYFPFSLCVCQPHDTMK